ncbi:MAG: hypothetical protein ABI354_02700 [Candidatus Saccharimonadales bacterium]
MSGRVLGAHQKIDRVARKQLGKLIPDATLFPKSGKILHFEGQNGPDAIKRKSPAQDEPWHYFNPFNDDDNQLLELIQDHYDRLVKALKDVNKERVSFEAAWLAHAIVDGLTPAHHYPYEEKLVELRNGEGIETRNTLKAKWILPGANSRERLANNWKMWGAKGLFTTHAMFEMGVAAIIAPLAFSEVTVTPAELKSFREIGVKQWFRETAREVAVLDMYVDYYKKGWTSHLASEVRHKLGPIMIHSVMIAWYAAMHDAKLIKVSKV